MIDSEAKAKLGRKLTGALHQAPDNPEQFVTVTRQVLLGNSLHITDLSITIGGDLTADLAMKLQEARRNAPPTLENLLDLASTKLNLGGNSERLLGSVLGVSIKTLRQCKRDGRVPRAWFERIQALPELDETRSHLDLETKRLVQVLAEAGYSPEEIHAAFQRIRTLRAGIKQIANAAFGDGGNLVPEEVERMRDSLFGDRPQSEQRIKVWLTTHLRREYRDAGELTFGLSPREVERIRARFERETELRRNSPDYHRAAIAAELIERPLRTAARSSGDARKLRATLGRIFGSSVEDGLTARLAQFTGLDDRHALDLLKGANGVGAAWWEFLEDVEVALQSAPISLSRRQLATTLESASRLDHQDQLSVD